VNQEVRTDVRRRALQEDAAAAGGISTDYRAAVVIALGLTLVLGRAAGVAMSVPVSQAVGLESQGLALFGWNRLAPAGRPLLPA